MATNNNHHRKRGVRASRARLTHALTEAGLRTQAALADRIADLEDLDGAPKDAVNRVFRELPVELATLERVARALGVDAYTLYLTADETDAAEDEPLAPPPGRRRHDTATLVMAVVIVLLAAGWWLTGRQSAPDGDAPASAVAPLGLGSPTLVVMPFAGDGEQALTAALRDALAADFTVATDSATVLTRSLPPRAAAERLRSDVVVDGEIVDVGRQSGVRVWLLARDVRLQIWAESHPAVALPGVRAAMVGRIATAVRRAAGLPVAEGAPGYFPLAPVQDDYLDGMLHLDRPSSELNIKRAQSRFEAALRQDANYARAHAGLCQTLLEEHWMADEERALQDAARACGQALQLAPGDPVVRTAHAHFLRRTGRNDEALALYAGVTADAPLDATALNGYAASLLAAYRQTGERDYLLRAKKMARRGGEVDPAIWKPLFALATMEWFDGDVAAAIAASEAARARNENEYVLANLGSFYLCDGAFEEAREAWKTARDLAPQSYVGDEFLGMAHYFLGDFDESARLRQAAIEKVAAGEPEIHEMWGNLGDAYRQAGNKTAAIDAYLRAAEIAERDHLRGNAPVADRAARAYYYTMLEQLAPAYVPDSVSRGIADQLDDIEASLQTATAHRRMAQIRLARDEPAAARRALDRAAATCRGYARMPDFAGLQVTVSSRDDT